MREGREGERERGKEGGGGRWDGGRWEGREKDGKRGEIEGGEGLREGREEVGGNDKDGPVAMATPPLQQVCQEEGSVQIWMP